jgi:hypothetical protein
MLPLCKKDPLGKEAVEDKFDVDLDFGTVQDMGCASGTTMTTKRPQEETNDEIAH